MRAFCCLRISSPACWAPERRRRLAAQRSDGGHGAPSHPERRGGGSWTVSSEEWLGAKTCKVAGLDGGCAASCL